MFRKNKTRPLAGRSAYFSSNVSLVSYWLYFKDRATAETAAERVRALGLAADVEEEARYRVWLVLAYADLPEEPVDVARIAEAMRVLARSLQGKYERWEAGPLAGQAQEDMVRSWVAQGIGLPGR